jgi:alanine racemase
VLYCWRKIICALKCNAYGFRYLEAAEQLLSLGAYGVAVPEARVDDEVVLIGKQGNEEITLDFVI